MTVCTYYIALSDLGEQRRPITVPRIRDLKFFGAVNMIEVHSREVKHITAICAWSIFNVLDERFS